MPSNTETYRVLPVGATFDASGRNRNSEPPKQVAARLYAKGTHESTVFTDGEAPRCDGKRKFGGGAQRETSVDAPSAVQLKQPSAAAQAYNSKLNADAAGAKPTGSKRVIPPPANHINNSCALVEKEGATQVPKNLYSKDALPLKQRRHYANTTHPASTNVVEGPADSAVPAAPKTSTQPAARRRLVADLTKDPFNSERTKGEEAPEPSTRQKNAADARNKTGESMQYAMGQKTYVAQKSNYKLNPPYEVEQNE